MIPFDFEYYRPDNLTEAVDIFTKLTTTGKFPVYYGGGSELISMSRVGNVKFNAVIDVKSIPDCQVLDFENNNLILGAANTLSAITETNHFPLLTKTAGRIADHTMQCKITLGGNLSSTIIYRETVLPLLLTEATLTIAGPDGLRNPNVNDIFKERMQLKEGEFIVNTAINTEYLNLPYYHIKKTRHEKIDYPLITVACLKINHILRIAFSGLASYPFRSLEVEEVFNDNNLTFTQRIEKISQLLFGVLLNDSYGSAEYRKFVLCNTLMTILKDAEDN